MTSPGAGKLRFHTRGLRCLLGIATVTLAGLPFLAGCTHFNPFKTKEKAIDKVDAAPAEPQEVVTAPRKYQMRIAPYLFLSDVKISRDQPLFQELAELRDQVMKELL